MRPTGWLALLATFFISAATAVAEPIAVDVTNASEPVLCAEKDNVTLNLASPQVRAFRIEAAHPAYIGTLQRDSFEADWTGCTAPGDPAAGKPEPPRRTTLYEEIDFWIVGLTFQNFWRPATATVRIGNRVEKGLHLLQVWMIRPMGGEEVARALPAGRLLAPAAAGAGRHGADRVRLVVPRRPRRGGGAPDRAGSARSPSIPQRAPSRSPSSAAAPRP